MNDPLPEPQRAQTESADSVMLEMVAAAVGSIDEVMLPLRCLVAVPNLQQGAASYLAYTYQQRAIREMRMKGYKTNDIVLFTSELSKALQEPKINVNGVDIDLEVREILLVIVLMQQARNRAQSRTLSRDLDSDFLSVSSLIREIDRIKAAAGLEELWKNAIDTDVHKTVSRLRRKLVRLGFNRNLIEGKRGVGYRLSTPHWNLFSPATTTGPLAANAQS